MLNDIWSVKSPCKLVVACFFGCKSPSHHCPWDEIYFKVSQGWILLRIVNFMVGFFDKNVISVKTAKRSESLIEIVFLWALLQWSLCMISWCFLLFKGTTGQIFEPFITIGNRFRIERVISLPIFKIRVISLPIFKIRVIFLVKEYFLFRRLSELRKIQICDIFATFLVPIVGIFTYGLRLSKMIGNSFASAFLLCEKGTLNGLLHRINTLLVRLNCLWFLAFSLVVLKVICSHDGLNIRISFEVLLYKFVYIFLVNSLDVTVNKHLLLLFQPDFDRLLKFSHDLFLRFMKCFEVSSKGKIK